MINSHGEAVDPPCSSNPDLWFSEHTAGISAAKAGCAECPLKTACLIRSADHALQEGVWGGLSVAERRTRLGYFADGTVGYKKGRRRRGSAACLQCEAPPAALTIEVIGSGRWPLYEVGCTACGIRYKGTNTLALIIEAAHTEEADT